MSQAVVGIVLALIGQGGESFGLVVQKKAHIKNQALPPAQRKPYIFLPVWLLGFAIFVVGNLTVFVSLGMASQSLVAPLGSISLIVNAVSATFLLKERFTKKHFVAICLIIAGIIMIVVVSKEGTREYDLEELLALYRRAEFIVYITFIGIVLVSIYSFMKVTEKKKRFDKITKLQEKFLQLAYPCFGATVASITILFAKASSELINLAFQGQNEFSLYFTYIILFIFITSAVSQIHWINVSLTVNEALFHIPVFFVLWNILSIIGGSVYYDEMAAYSPTDLVIFCIGLVPLFTGVVLLSIAAKEDSSTPEARYVGEGDSELSEVILIDKAEENGADGASSTPGEGLVGYGSSEGASDRTLPAAGPKHRDRKVSFHSSVFVSDGQEKPLDSKTGYAQL